MAPRFKQGRTGTFSPQLPWFGGEGVHQGGVVAALGFPIVAADVRGGVAHEVIANAFFLHLENRPGQSLFIARLEKFHNGIIKVVAVDFGVRRDKSVMSDASSSSSFSCP